MRKILTLIIALVAGVGTIFAESGKCGENVTWELNDGLLTISGTGNMYNYEAAIDGFRSPWDSDSKRLSITAVQILNGVTSIGDYAFDDCSNVTYVSIGNSVQKIGEGAFEDCMSLEKITIPSNVTSIGQWAFGSCTNLSSVHLSEGVSKIYSYAFFQCGKLTYINIPSTMTDIKLDAFDNAIRTVRWNVPSYKEDFSETTHLFPKITSIIFGDDVEYIPSHFCSNLKIKNVTFGKNVRNIGPSAFHNCDSLKTLTMGEGVQRIGSSAFAGCDSLKSVTLNDNLKFIGASAFSNCEKIGSIVIPDHVDTISSGAFTYSLKNSVTIGEGVKYIHPKAFSGCPLRTIVWNVKNYTKSVSGDESPFANLTNILFVTTFKFGENVEYIPAELCAGMAAMTSITIPANVKKIGKNAFLGCTSLAQVVWNAKECDDFALADDAPFYSVRQQIYSFAFGDKVTFIPSYLCYEMTYLYKVTIPASVTRIGNHSFDGCQGFTGKDIVIPNDVVSVGEYAFANCDLHSVTIGGNVSTIGKYAFMGNEKMKAVYNEAETPQNIAANVFSDLDLSACDLYVPESSIPAYQNANVWKTFKSFTPICRYGSGTTGGMKWYHSCNGHLAISGTGDMADYTLVESIPTAPWRAGDEKWNKTILSAEVSDGITSIGDNAFYNCRAMTQVYIPNSVTKIGKSSFYGCNVLEAVTLSDNIASIGWNAFNQCSALTSITLPVHLTRIEGQAFFMCSGLTSLEIPEEVESIGEDAFGYCTNLMEVNIPASVTSIDARAFAGNSKLEVIRNDATTPQNIDANVFSNVNKSKCLLIVPKSALAAYMNAPVWKDFIVMSTEDILASGNCGAEGDNLTWMLTNDGILVIRGTGEMGWTTGNAPWYSWRSSILSVIIGSGATSIAPTAFMSCEALSKVDIPNTVTSIGDGAFTQCYGLSEITIPASVNSIGNYAFFQCSSIPSIVIPEGVTSLGTITFMECTNLSSITLPSTLTSIGTSAFSTCTSLTSITIPASVETIDVSAFANCHSLKSVTNERPVPQTINRNVFDNLDLSTIRLYVPENVVNDYKAKDVWKEFSPILPIGTTGVEGVLSSEYRVQKVIREGQLFIEKDGKVYTVMGQIVR